MLDEAAIDRLVRNVALARLGTSRISRVHSQPMLDTRGEPAVLITTTFEDIQDMLGREGGSLSFLSGIWDGLAEDGDERIPILSFLSGDEHPPSDDRTSSDLG